MKILCVIDRDGNRQVSKIVVKEKDLHLCEKKKVELWVSKEKEVEKTVRGLFFVQL